MKVAKLVAGVSDFTHIQPSELKNMTVSEWLGLLDYLSDKKKEMDKITKQMEKVKRKGR